MQKIPVAIIGGGLSGLYAAYLLEQQGIDYILLEARDILGGRILSSKSLKDNDDNTDAKTGTTNNGDSFDLGPSWYWPAYQQQLARLVDDLSLKSFAQFEDGDMMVERSAIMSPVQSPGYQSSPPSMRLVAGMSALIEALYSRLDSTRINTGHIVHQITHTGEHIEIGSKTAAGQTHIWQAEQVLLALPPRLAATNINFQPALPVELATQWQTTATWMAPHAKYFAVYDKPFWREQGLSGEGRSAIGPLVEIHDASVQSSHGALFGFVGVPAASRQSVSTAVLKDYCRAQLVRLFGSEADAPIAEYLKDWAQDPFTATAADAHSDGQHASAPMTKATAGVWADCLTGIGSEWSRQFPGYVAGAVEAAGFGVESLVGNLSKD
jgi:monoamine oxidase